MYELIITLSGLGSVEPRALAATSRLDIGSFPYANSELASANSEFASASVCKLSIMHVYYYASTICAPGGLDDREFSGTNSLSTFDGKHCVILTFLHHERCAGKACPAAKLSADSSGRAFCDAVYSFSADGNAKS